MTILYGGYDLNWISGTFLIKCFRIDCYQQEERVILRQEHGRMRLLSWIQDRWNENVKFVIYRQEGRFHRKWKK